VKRFLTVVAACAGVLAAPTAHAEPAVPQVNSVCHANLAGAYTQLPDLTTWLECSHSWQVVDDPYPKSDRWFTYGPVLTLHGEAQRNREIDSGDWIAEPQDAASGCVATQTRVVEAGGVGPPEVSSGRPGQPLTMRLRPMLFTVELSGHCLWQKANVDGPAPVG
jgi:hypothetical protein